MAQDVNRPVAVLDVHQNQPFDAVESRRWNSIAVIYCQRFRAMSQMWGRENDHSRQWLINYGRRYTQNRTISATGAESAVDYVIGQRIKRNGHTRWSQEGANALLQVRCAVVNRQDVRNFKRWYRPGQRIESLRVAAVAA
jgi:hypothetical protein